MIGLILKLLPLVLVGLAFRGNLGALSKSVTSFAHFSEVMLTQKEMSLYAREIGSAIFHEGRPPRDLQKFLVKQLTEDGIERRDMTVDPWKNHYEVFQEKGVWYIGSMGPDSAWSTEDDIYVTIPVRDRWDPL